MARSTQSRLEIVVPWLPGRIKAITLWPLILYKKGHYTRCVKLHEYYHWRQVQEWGVIPWYLVYLLLGVFYAGKPAREHPLERAAYQLEDACEENL